MKKLISFILALTMLLSVAGCTKKVEDDIIESDNKTFAESVTQSEDEVKAEKSFKEITDLKEEPSDKNEEGSIKNETVKIDNIDKLNFYATKKSIAEGDSAPSTDAASILNSTNASGSNVQSINPNSSFTITMYSYFTVSISDVNGFLAKKLGSTGSVEVVITKNNFSNMITFKKGNRYYSCLETASSEKQISFTTNKYVNGFNLIENKDGENYEFTVSFEGDRVVGINCKRYLASGSNFKNSPDEINLNNNFSFLIFKKQTFSAVQLEKMFEKNTAFIDDGVVLNDGTILFGEASATDTNANFKNSRNETLFAATDIKKVAAMQNTRFGYSIRLSLKNADKLGKKENVNLYIDSKKIMNFTLQKEGNTVYLTQIESKSRMSDIFYKLTVADTKNRIGRITTPEEFEYEISKKVNLDDYNLQIEDNSEYYNSGYNATHRYTLKEDKNLSYTDTNYEITIDGITFSLPIRVSDFVDLGFDIKNVDFNNDVLAGGITFETPEGKTFSTYIMDFYNNSTNMYNCYITQLNFLFYEDRLVFEEGKRRTAPKVDVLYGINNNSTLDDIISRLGTPNRLIVHFNENEEMNYRTSSIQAYFNFSTPEIPNGYFICNIYPVTNRVTPSDFLVHFSIVLQ